MHPSMTPADLRLRVRLGFLHPQRFLGRKNAPTPALPPSLLREAGGLRPSGGSSLKPQRLRLQANAGGWNG
jgi:hypothetical protein